MVTAFILLTITFNTFSRPFPNLPLIFFFSLKKKKGPFYIFHIKVKDSIANTFTTRYDALDLGTAQEHTRTTAHPNRHGNNMYVCIYECFPLTTRSIFFPTVRFLFGTNAHKTSRFGDFTGKNWFSYILKMPKLTPQPLLIFKTESQPSAIKMCVDATDRFIA